MGWKAKFSAISLPTDFGDFPSLKLQNSIPANPSFLGKNHFHFLNIKHDFSTEIDWNFAKYGKLWTYNLNYFEFLSQANLDKETGLSLIKKYIAAGETLQDGLEPFPISLRMIFWIRFLVKHQIQDAQIDAFLFRQNKLLEQQLEYHLLGNHLLENGFALLHSAYYFSDNQLFSKAKQILSEQLEEQILASGAHFELAPMYHQLMLYRLLDCINLIQNNRKIFPTDWLNFLIEKAGEMLAWLDYMSFSDGSIPHFNDSTDGIAPTTKELKEYAKTLEITPKQTTSKICSQNYRKYKSSQYEIFVDTGEIGAAYIPGHAHSDNLHFVLNSQGKSLLVDTGISTYEKDQKRHFERSTAAHNTVQIKNEEQSDVWGGFRVGRRAESTLNMAKSNKIQATHNGYSFMDVYHERTFQLQEKVVEIIDKLSTITKAKARFHFHPDVKVSKDKNTVSGDFGSLAFEGMTAIALEEYQFAQGYNQTQTATVIVVHFSQHLHTTIELK